MATTLAELIARTRSRGDFGAASSSSEDDFVTNEEIVIWLNQSRAKLYRRLIKAGIIVRRASVDITANGAADYALGDNATVFSVIAAGYVASAYDVIPLELQGIRRMNSGLVGGWATEYLVFESDDIGSLRVSFGPSVPSSGTYRVVYIPEQTPLAQLSDSVYFPHGWDEIMVLEACFKGKKKGDEPIDDDWVREHADLWKQIDTEADERSAADGNVIENVDDPGRGYSWRWRQGGFFWP
jgi:hypothetical protein